MFRALALGTMAGGTIRGSTALRVGWLTAKKPCWTASSANTTHTDRTFAIAVTHRPMLVSAMPVDVMISRMRRS